MANGEYDQIIIDCAENFGVECDGEYVPPDDPTIECCSVCREVNEKATSSDDFSRVSRPALVSVVCVVAVVATGSVVWYVRYNKRAARSAWQDIVVGEHTGKEVKGGNVVIVKSVIETNAG